MLFYVWHSLTLVKTEIFCPFTTTATCITTKKSMASLENKPPVCFSAADTQLIHSYIKP